MGNIDIVLSVVDRIVKYSMAFSTIVLNFFLARKYIFEGSKIRYKKEEGDDKTSNTTHEEITYTQISSVVKDYINNTEIKTNSSSVTYKK